MALIDNTGNLQPRQNSADAAQFIRNLVAQEGKALQSKLNTINSLVTLHTRATIASELGSDAAEMLTLYNQMKTLAEAIDSAYTGDDLPA